MATNYRNYAENLIGNWNTDQYQPKRDVALATYQTNWEALQNDFNNYLDKFKRDLDRSRTNYYNTLSDIDRNNFLNVNNAVENLAKRGVLNSGLASRYGQAIASARGQSVANALDKIVNTSTSATENMANLVKGMGASENKLNTSLASTLGGIAAQEQANNQAYQNLAAGIAAGKEARDIANAVAGASKAAQEEQDEEKRRILIADTLRNGDLSDNEKVRYMSMYLDVPADVGEAAVKGYNDNQKLTEYTKRLTNMESSPLDSLTQIDNINPLIGTAYGLTTGPIGGRLSNATMATSAINVLNALKNNRANKKAELKGKIEDLSYSDLYNILYGNK